MLERNDCCVTVSKLRKEMEMEMSWAFCGEGWGLEAVRWV